MASSSCWFTWLESVHSDLFRIFKHGSSACKRTCPTTSVENQPRDYPPVFCRWYTSMLGKKSSVAALKRTLTDSQVRTDAHTYIHTHTHLYLLTAKIGHVGLPGRGERDSKGILER